MKKKFSHFFTSRFFYKWFWNFIRSRFKKGQALVSKIQSMYVFSALIDHQGLINLNFLISCKHTCYRPLPLFLPALMKCPVLLKSPLCWHISWFKNVFSLSATINLDTCSMEWKIYNIKTTSIGYYFLCIFACFCLVLLGYFVDFSVVVWFFQNKFEKRKISAWTE